MNVSMTITLLFEYVFLRVFESPFGTIPTRNTTRRNATWGSFSRDKTNGNPTEFKENYEERDQIENHRPLTLDITFHLLTIRPKSRLLGLPVFDRHLISEENSKKI